MTLPGQRAVAKACRAGLDPHDCAAGVARGVGAFAAQRDLVRGHQHPGGAACAIDQRQHRRIDVYAVGNHGGFRVAREHRGGDHAGVAMA